MFAETSRGNARPHVRPGIFLARMFSPSPRGCLPRRISDFTSPLGVKPPLRSILQVVLVLSCRSQRSYFVGMEGRGFTGCGKSRRQRRALIPAGDKFNSRGQRPRKALTTTADPERVDFRWPCARFRFFGLRLYDPFWAGEHCLCFPGALPPVPAAGKIRP
jgi:hypothetical protein